MALFKTLISFFVLCSFAKAQESTSLYLVVYKEQDARKVHSLKGQNLNRYLREQTTANENRWLASQTLNLSRKNSLWILNATIVGLQAQQVSMLRQAPYVSDIVPLGRKFQIRPPQNLTDKRDLTREFTYGLIKIGMPEVRSRYVGLEGRGIRVGVIDTGITLNHPDFAGRIIKFRDFVSKRPLAYDDHGHGTHVAGTVAGSNTSGRLIGVAPGAELIIAKSFNSRGNTIDADLLLSMQWMADPDDNPETDDGAHIVNNSWNTEMETSDRVPESDPFCTILPRLKALNVLPVFAAGNDGPRENTVTPPAACPDSLSVGSTDQEDKISDFSSRGPVRWKNITLNKPDLSAPGKGVYSADLGSRYRTRSGTSMAAPHVAGALAVLKQARPELSVYQLEDLVKASVRDLGTPGYDYQYGHGRLDLMKGLSF